MIIHPLSEGAFTVDKTKQFIPFSQEKDVLQERTNGSLLVEIQPFLIKTSKDIIVIDTGLGFLNEDGVMQIHKNLSDHGISASDVTKVLMSHMHKDHSGGICRTISGERVLSFENATYYINRQELDFAMEKGKPSYYTEDFPILQNNPRVKLTEAKGWIDNYISYEVTGGHCPFHQVFHITEEDQNVFFGGDISTQLQQMKSRFVAKYDYDGRKCMELRQQWWKQGEEEKWIFLFYHDIKTPVWKFNGI